MGMKKRHKKRRHKKKKRSSSSSDSSDEDLDLEKELYPISHYINDREEMITQVFSVLKGKKLKSMLPPFLVDMDIEQLKSLCSDQLIGMSKKRIQCVIAGKEMAESSNTDTDDEDDMDADNGDGRGEYERESDESEEQKEERGPQSTVSQDPRAATSLKRTQKIAFGNKGEEAPKKKVILSTGKTTVHERVKGKSPKPETKPAGEVVGEEKGKTLMELLELEMRARAIKALLMKAGKEEGEAESLAIEEALEEAKEKEKDKGTEPKEEKKVEEAETDKEEKKRSYRKRKGSEDEEMEVEDKKEESEGEEEEETNERVFQVKTKQ